jgi:hypothetical protein
MKVHDRRTTTMITTIVTKALKRKEVELGFLHIPVKNRTELLGETIAPFDTKLNNFPAKVDKQGRLVLRTS